MSIKHIEKLQTTVVISLSILLIGVIFAYFQLSTYSSASGNNNNQVPINVSNNVDVNPNATGVTITISTDDLAVISGSGILNVAELVVTFDPAILRLDSITPNSSLLDLNEQINNTLGRATIDVAQPVTEFPAGTDLATFNFTVLQQTNTTVRLDNASTFGYPNRLNHTGSNNAYVVTFSTSSSSTTTSSATSSATTSAGRAHDVTSSYVLLQAEDFDNGGQNEGYFDRLDDGGAPEFDTTYRAGEGVDIKNLGGGVRVVGLNRTGEWLDFTVNVLTAGTYNVSARVSTSLNTARIGLERNSVSLFDLAVPNTGSYTSFTNLAMGTTALPSGIQTFRMNVVTEYFDIDWIRFDLQAASSTSSSTSTTTSTATSTTTSTSTSTTTSTSSATTTTTSSTSSATSSAANNQIPVYRFFDYAKGTHFFTASVRERDKVIADLSEFFAYEGIAFYVFPDSNNGQYTPVYRFFDLNKGVHFFTASRSERDNLIGTPDFPYEGIAYYVRRDVAVNQFPIYRFFNLERGVHFYTASESERSRLNPSVFAPEGIAYYVPQIR